MEDLSEASDQTLATGTLSPSKYSANETRLINRPLWVAGACAILVLGACLRLYDLNLVPLHHDEGVNGNFLKYLVREGYYEYDPQNYHGPTLYYFSAVVPWLSRFLFGNHFGDLYGLSTFTIRFVTAAFGVATIWLLLTLRRRIDSVAALAGATLLAFSPGAVYLSRYFIHEMLLVFFTLALVSTALRFYETGRPTYLMLAAASAALMFATKETTIISASVLVIALVSTTVIMRLREIHEDERQAGKGREILATLQEHLKATIARFGGPLSLAILSIAALSLFLTIDILFYSSFFTNYPKGLYDALKTFEFWTKTGTRDHLQPWSTYFVWMLKEESPVLLLGLAGVAVAIWRRSNRFAVFTALWAVGTFAAYSLIPYKTPWLMVNFLVPLAIMGGYGFEAIYRQARLRKQPLVAVVIAVVALGVSGYQTVALNFVHYDNESYVYVYAHTRRDFLRIVEEIDRIAKRAGTGEQTGITVTSPDYWPLPWYLRNYPLASYDARVISSNQPIVIGSKAQEAELEAMFGGGRYSRINSGLNATGTYPLRPRVELVLLVRRDIATQLGSL